MKKLFFSLSLALMSTVNAQVVTTIAGTGAAGSADGAALTTATFYRPSASCVDGSGNIYVADFANNKIRKITAAGIVSTLTGTFSGPSGITIDPSGNLYVVESDACKIDKIDTAGNVSVLAGSGTAGYLDAVGTAAKFYNPWGIAIDKQGANLYVADQFNNRIRKINISTKQVTTIAGTGTSGSQDGAGASASFKYPCGITVGADNSLYIADSSNCLIRKIDASGNVSTLAGTAGWSGYADGQGTAAKFNFPFGITVDQAQNVYVADTYNNRIRKITSTGSVSTYAGSGTAASVDGTDTSAQFYSPRSIALIRGGGGFYVTDYIGNKIRKITDNSVLATSEKTTALPTTTFYPNPVSATLNFSKDQKSVEIFDVTGKKLSVPFTKTTADLSKLPAGSYIVRSTDEKGDVSSQKVIKK